MPKIPTIISNRLIPGESGLVPMHPGYAGVEAGARAEAGAALARTGLQLYGAVTDLQKRELEAQRQIKAMEMERIGGEEFGRLADSYKTRTDYENWDEDYARSLNEIRGKLSKVAGEDQKLGLAMENYLNDQGRSFGKILRDKKFQVMSDQAAAEFLYASDQALSEYQMEFDENKKNLIKSRIATSAGNLVRSGLMWEREATQHILEFDRKTKALDAKQAETLADASLNERFPGDYDAQIKALEDPKEYRKMNLTVEQANNLAGIIRNRQVKTETVRKERYDQTNRSFFLAFQKNELSLEMVREAVEIEKLDPKSAEHWIEEIKKQIADPQAADPETDYAVYAEVRAEVLRARTPAQRDAAQKKIFANLASLSKKDREKLIDLNLKEEDRDLKEEIKKAEKYLERMILPNAEGLFTSKNPEDYQNYYDAVESLNNEIERRQKTAKPMSGKEIMDKAREIAPRYQLTIREQMEREEKTMKAFMEGTSGKEKMTDEVSRPRTKLNPLQEEKFKEWYAGISQGSGLNPDPDDPNHFYDYRAAFKAGVRGPGKEGHWPSEYKLPGHPDQFVNGINTITGKAATDEDVRAWLLAKGYEGTRANIKQFKNRNGVK